MNVMQLAQVSVPSQGEQLQVKQAASISLMKETAQVAEVAVDKLLEGLEDMPAVSGLGMHIDLMV